MVRNGMGVFMNEKDNFYVPIDKQHLAQQDCLAGMRPLGRNENLVLLPQPVAILQATQSSARQYTNCVGRVLGANKR